MTKVQQKWLRFFATMLADIFGEQLKILKFGRSWRQIKSVSAAIANTATKVFLPMNSCWFKVCNQLMLSTVF